MAPGAAYLGCVDGEVRTALTRLYRFCLDPALLGPGLRRPPMPEAPGAARTAPGAEAVALSVINACVVGYFSSAAIARSMVGLLSVRRAGSGLAGPVGLGVVTGENWSG